MDVTVIAFLALLGAVAGLRLVELYVSRRHQRALAARGAEKIRDPQFLWMVLLHSGILAGAAAEVVFLRRPFYPALATAMGALFLAANAVRWWGIRTLGEHWSVQVVDSTRLGVVTSGPYRYIRHPNYVAVFAEMIALPLIHSAWLTAFFGTLAHVRVLRQRLAVEERILLADPNYRAAMRNKPRFLPKLF